MSITSSGIMCDVCNYYILFEPINYFKIDGIKQMLHGHDKCWKIVQKAEKENDWKLLPEGKLRKSFEKADKELKELKNHIT